MLDGMIFPYLHPKRGNMTPLYKDILILALTALTFLFTVKRYKDGRRLAAIREAMAKTSSITASTVTAVLLGPRGAGKTSLVRIWTSPWMEVAEVSPTDTWRPYETTICEFTPEPFFDEFFQVKRTRIPTLRLSISDYPGEPRYRVEAVKQLKHLDGKCVLICFFRVGWEKDAIAHGGENAEYYSRMFVDEIERHIANVSMSVSRVFVVFNKRDLLPADWDQSRVLEELETANADALHNLRRLFSGRIDTHCISVWTNEGAIRLLGNVSEIALTRDGDRAYLRKLMTKAEEYFGQPDN